MVGKKLIGGIVQMSKCPECGQELSSTAQYCTNCGFRLNKPRLNKQVLRKTYIEIGISVILIIIAISLVTKSEFSHYANNISYYAEQYAETKSHSSGFLGSSYASLASRWKEMYNEAVTYVALHSVGAVILSIVGGIGLYKGLKKLKSDGGTTNGTY